MRSQQDLDGAAGNRVVRIDIIVLKAKHRVFVFKTLYQPLVAVARRDAACYSHIGHCGVE